MAHNEARKLVWEKSLQTKVSMNFVKKSVVSVADAFALTLKSVHVIVPQFTQLTS